MIMPKLTNIFAKLTCKAEGHDFIRRGPNEGIFYPGICKRCGESTVLMEGPIHINCRCINGPFGVEFLEDDNRETVISETIEFTNPKLDD